MTEPIPLTPIPPRSVLFHVGAMKSGTTAVQRAAHRRRSELLEHGVRYPGPRMNHFTAVAAFMGLRREGELPDPATWHDLMARVDAEQSRRVLLSHEWACEADEQTVAGFTEALGERLHVVITLRPLSGLLGSYWQEIVKNGQAAPPFGEWLGEALATPPGARQNTQWDRQCDQAGMVRRWAQALGPDRVTVVIADKADPARVPTSLEQLLDLPTGILVAETDGAGANRSLSPAEAEFFRRQNHAFRRSGVPFREYALDYRRRSVARLLATEPDPSAGRIVLPQWAAEQAITHGQEIAEQIAGSGARIVGDLAALHAPVSSAVPGELPVPETIPIDSAVEAVVASVLVGTGREGTKGATPAGTSRAEVIKERVGALPGGRTALRGARAARQWLTDPGANAS